MQWRNSPERYGKLALTLHWSVAALFLLLYVSVYYRQWFTENETSQNWTALQLHLSFGITALVFIFLRVVYKLWDQSPKEVPGPKHEHLAATLAHLALYAVMITMPLTAYFGTSVDTEFFFAFDIPQFREAALYNTIVINGLGLTWEEFEGPMDFIHKNAGAYLVWILILLHIAAALYHHFHRKGNALRRMFPVKLK